MALDWNLARFKPEDLPCGVCRGEQGQGFLRQAHRGERERSGENEIRFLRDVEETNKTFFATEFFRRG